MPSGDHDESATKLAIDTWNASGQGADAAGRYASKLVNTSNAYESGRNYYFPKGV